MECHITKCGGGAGRTIETGRRTSVDQAHLAVGTGDLGHRAEQPFLKEMAADNLTIVDCTNVLRGGVPDPAEWNDEYEEYRYRVHTQRICVVIVFTSEEELFIVTTWRKS